MRKANENKKPRREREKESRLNEIIDTAERIFAEKGYDLATMDEIAREAEFTKKTVYGYFPNKGELFAAVTVRAMNVLISFFKEAVSEGSNGFKKVTAIGMSYIRFYEEYPEYFKILSIRVNNEKVVEGDHSSEVLRLNMEVFTLITECFEIGRKDGSIRKDINSKMATLHVVSVSSGILEMVSSQRKNFKKYFGMSASEFINYSMDLIGDSIISGKRG